MQEIVLRGRDQFIHDEGLERNAEVVGKMAGECIPLGFRDRGNLVNAHIRVDVVMDIGERAAVSVIQSGIPLHPLDIRPHLRQKTPVLRLEAAERAPVVRIFNEFRQFGQEPLRVKLPALLFSVIHIDAGQDLKLKVQADQRCVRRETERKIHLGRHEINHSGIELMPAFRCVIDHMPAPLLQEETAAERQRMPAAPDELRAAKLQQPELQQGLAFQQQRIAEFVSLPVYGAHHSPYLFSVQ
ncbi:hypothetical protein SDC9_148132 [bioreactor metagenome]|uniref:Uncharacterized protein n=1 Tax=bioreactor metagenome TaxID=1076179 RepID=A0A645EJP0_9ZZZZ